MASVPSTVVPDVIEALGRVYAVRDENDVRRFLAAHPDLLALLAEAPTNVPNLLATGHPLGIEVLRDTEDEGAEGVLFVTVPTHAPPEEAMPLMDELLRGWLLDATRRSQGRFNIAFAYV